MLIKVLHCGRIKLSEVELCFYRQYLIFYLKDKIYFLSILCPPIRNSIMCVLLRKFSKDCRFKHIADNLFLQPFQPEHLHKPCVVKIYLRQFEKLGTDIAAEGPDKLDYIGIFHYKNIFFYSLLGYSCCILQFRDIYLLAAL